MMTRPDSKCSLVAIENTTNYRTLVSSNTVITNNLLKISDDVFNRVVLSYLDTLDLGYLNFTSKREHALIKTYFSSKDGSQYKALVALTVAAEQLSHVSPILLEHKNSINSVSYKKLEELYAAEEREYNKPKAVIKRTIAYIASFAATIGIGAYLLYRGLKSTELAEANAAVRSNYQKTFLSSCRDPNNSYQSELWSCDSWRFSFYKPCEVLNLQSGCDLTSCYTNHDAYCATEIVSDNSTSWYAGGAGELVIGNAVLICLMVNKVCKTNAISQSDVFSKLLSTLPNAANMVTHLEQILKINADNLMKKPIYSVLNIIEKKITDICLKYKALQHISAPSLSLFLEAKRNRNQVTITIADDEISESTTNDKKALLTL
jgi:hypothetical protein